MKNLIILVIVLITKGIAAGQLKTVIAINENECVNCYTTLEYFMNVNHPIQIICKTNSARSVKKLLKERGIEIESELINNTSLFEKYAIEGLSSVVLSDNDSVIYTSAIKINDINKVHSYQELIKKHTLVKNTIDIADSLDFTSSQIDLLFFEEKTACYSVKNNEVILFNKDRSYDTLVNLSLNVAKVIKGLKIETEIDSNFLYNEAHKELIQLSTPSVFQDNQMAFITEMLYLAKNTPIKIDSVNMRRTQSHSVKNILVTYDINKHNFNFYELPSFYQIAKILQVRSYGINKIGEKYEYMLGNYSYEKNEYYVDHFISYLALDEKQTKFHIVDSLPVCNLLKNIKLSENPIFINQKYVIKNNLKLELVDIKNCNSIALEAYQNALFKKPETEQKTINFLVLDAKINQNQQLALVHLHEQSIYYSEHNLMNGKMIYKKEIYKLQDPITKPIMVTVPRIDNDGNTWIIMKNSNRIEVIKN